MQSKEISGSIFGLTILALIVFAVLKWIDIPVGDFLDWVVALAIVWWLTLVTTVPWNMHFKAKEVISDAQRASNTQIKIKTSDLDYASRIAKIYLTVAIFMHIISAVGLYLLAYFQISPVGYIGAVAALMLTLLRPSVRMYAYIQYRLSAISQEIRYPKEDINTLKMRLDEWESTLRNIEYQQNPNNMDSQTAQILRNIESLKQDHRQLHERVAQIATSQKQDFDLLSKNTEKKIARLSEDAQFLNQVRELIRFVKEA
ncbi:MAG: hypothetical protein JJT94_14640 [Bernardetiaceae bacterium]|nr:hypothetical protein [Bernardetiaceae bacterium]